ncbi:hypothetical protein [Microbulbifer litoralis]|uniref:hypothetical protein n=1 Tax=Microbulbifer litoralis TaxID=2933965 RepID=UPI0020280704|nr:hypothetical protein [Microbulbifer sp. GX H0434]
MKASRLFLAWLLLTALFSALAHWQAQAAFARDLSRQLRAQLPEKMTLALQNRLGGGGLREWIAARLESDLDGLPATGRLALLDRCSAGVEQLLSDDLPPAPAAAGDIVVDWQLSGRRERTLLSVDCRAHWPLLVGSQALLALLLVALAALLPLPLPRPQRRQFAALLRRGVPAREARALSARLAALNPPQLQLFERLQPQGGQPLPELLDWLEQPQVAALEPSQWHWFERAMALNGGDHRASLISALAGGGLEFDCGNFRVLAHGIPLELSKTPFFYFLWYARRRLDGEGWYLNPPVNRPDRDSAASLVALMEEYGGHNKAINDLRENGLRAKTLDQNRNRIRDELLSTLGETLAQPYLFEAERDLKSGRYRYRLALPAGEIRFL